MKILLTNDDGIDAEGINSLYNVLSPHHEVYIIAPDRERSACSNIFTMRDDIKLHKIEENKFSISGYPADCVSIALHSDIVPEIDLVVSGINHGANLGDDIHFSGTVAAARTAHIFGKKSIAMSVNSFHSTSVYFDDASDFINEFIDKNELEPGHFLNINYPDVDKSEIKGTKYTFLSKRYYKDSYSQDHKDTHIELKLEGEILTEEKKGSDITEMNNGFISITPIHLDNTDYSTLKKRINE